METKSVYRYFIFGTGFRFLQDARAGLPIHGDGKIISVLERFFNNLEVLDLRVTYRASQELLEAFSRLKKLDQDAVLSVEQAEELKNLTQEIRPTLLAELQLFNVYLVNPKRIEVTKLLSNVHALFAPGVFDKLPEIARFDLMEAGKCIAYERPTAAGFHLMRATESVLRLFYLCHVRRGRLQLMWGQIVQNLRSKRKFIKNQEYITLFNNLDNIRLSFRNPTQHPEKVYDIHEVQDLWGLCVDVINRMSRDLPASDVENIPF